MLNFKDKIDEKKEEIKVRRSLFTRLRRVIMSDSMAQKLMFYFCHTHLRPHHQRRLHKHLQ